MKNLNELPRYIKEYEAIPLFKEKDIFVLDDESGVYADIRTTFDIKENIHEVYACAKDCMYFFYVCPSCGKLHSIHKTDSRKYHYPSCANYKKKNIAVVKNGKKLIFPLMKFRFHRYYYEEMKEGVEMLSNGQMVKRLETVIKDKSIEPEEKCSIIRSEFAGFNLYFPEKNLNFANIEERNEAIRKDYKNNLTIKELMSKYNLGESSIYKILQLSNN